MPQATSVYLVEYVVCAGVAGAAAAARAEVPEGMVAYAPMFATRGQAFEFARVIAREFGCPLPMVVEIECAPLPGDEAQEPG